MRAVRYAKYSSTHLLALAIAAKITKASSSFPAAEPASERATLAGGRQHLVLELRRKKRDQRSAGRRHQQRAIADIEHQLAAVGRAPVFVEVQHHRQHARIVVAQAIAMAAIAGTGRINRVVAFEVEESRIRRAIDGN